MHGDHLRGRDPARCRRAAGGAPRPRRAARAARGQAAVQPRPVQRGVGGAAQRVARPGRQPAALRRLDHLHALGPQRAHQLPHVDRGARRPAVGVGGVDQHPHRGARSDRQRGGAGRARPGGRCPLARSDGRRPAQLGAGAGQVRGRGARLAAVRRRRRQLARPRPAPRPAARTPRPAWPGGRRTRCRWRPGRPRSSAASGGVAGVGHVGEVARLAARRPAPASAAPPSAAAAKRAKAMSGRWRGP